MTRSATRWLGLMFVSVCMGSPAQAAYQDPLDVPAVMSVRATTSMLNAVTRTPAGRFVAVGRRGHVLLSEDGKSWRQAPVPVSTDLVAVTFVDADRGWAVGHGGVILASVDGGKTWFKQLDGRQAARLLVEHYAAQAVSNPQSVNAEDAADAARFEQDGPGRPFLDIWFDAAGQRGYAIGAYNLLFATIDGGKTWQPRPERMANERKLHLTAIANVGRDVFVAGEQGLLARLNPDTGYFDSVGTPYAGSFFGVTGQDGLLVLFGLQGNAYRSQDRGATWQKLESGFQAALTSGTVTEDGLLVLGGQNGTLLVSADQGLHFVALRPVDAAPIFGLAPAGPGRVVVVGARGARLQTLKK